MPDYKTIKWNEYQIQILPHGIPKDLIKSLPLFYGTLCFDMKIRPAKKKDVSKEVLTYYWTLCTSDDNEIFGKGKDTVGFAQAKSFNRAKNKVGDVTTIEGGFRKIGAVNLKHVSIPKQYKILMDFRDTSGNMSGEEIIADFTLLDRDRFAMNIVSLIIGAFFGAAFGALGSVLVFVFTRGQ